MTKIQIREKGATLHIITLSWFNWLTTDDTIWISNTGCGKKCYNNFKTVTKRKQRNIQVNERNEAF